MAATSILVERVVNDELAFDVLYNIISELEDLSFLPKTVKTLSYSVGTKRLTIELEQTNEV